MKPEEVKEWVKKEIEAWLEENNVEGHIQYHTDHYRGKGLPEYIVIHNGKGGLNKKQRFLNKWTLKPVRVYWFEKKENASFYLEVTARTDPKYADEELQKHFVSFMEDLIETIRGEI